MLKSDSCQQRFGRGAPVLPLAASITWSWPSNLKFSSLTGVVISYCPIPLQRCHEICNLTLFRQRGKGFLWFSFLSSSLPMKISNQPTSSHLFPPYRHFTTVYSVSCMFKWLPNANTGIEIHTWRLQNNYQGSMEDGGKAVSLFPHLPTPCHFTLPQGTSHPIGGFNGDMCEVLSAFLGKKVY